MQILYCALPKEKNKCRSFSGGHDALLKPLLSSPILNLLEGITRDLYIPVSWLENRETGPLCVWWDKEEGEVWRKVF